MVGTHSYPMFEWVPTTILSSYFIMLTHKSDADVGDIKVSDMDEVSLYPFLLHVYSGIRRSCLSNTSYF